jgi:hypothetical protein
LSKQFTEHKVTPVYTGKIKNNHINKW